MELTALQEDGEGPTVMHVSREVGTLRNVHPRLARGSPCPVAPKGCCLNSKVHDPELP